MDFLKKKIFFKYFFDSLNALNNEPASFSAGHVDFVVVCIIDILHYFVLGIMGPNAFHTLDNFLGRGRNYY